ncbi:hypothetical protein PT282_05650 [Bifidobacterium sp. ESL0763]|uniref:hypothetical protein n=1 Tax=Bifidobacterium sp. ESL0763 TaxID=2983227 RepID=UPI0023F90263|nr:hypothetical protein [Bifidobacterium sp. ESL0763]MDF7664144.1 hypothetical protein [Bifidobacterium sp. ESL0763]
MATVTINLPVDDEQYHLADQEARDNGSTLVNDLNMYIEVMAAEKGMRGLTPEQSDWRAMHPLPGDVVCRTPEESRRLFDSLLAED